MEVNSRALRDQRFLTLSLKKNRLKMDEKKEKMTRYSDVIILDESFDTLKSDITKCTKSVSKVYSPIVIDDSHNLSSEGLPHITLSSGTCTPTSREPSRVGNISFNGEEEETDLIADSPSAGSTWSPAQNITCATPRHKPVPATPKDVTRKSLEKCTMKNIEMSQKKLLTDLYGDVWKSLPTLFKNRKVPFGGTSKKLDFDDDDSDKENIKGNHAENKKLYLTESEIKRKEAVARDEEKKSKKKLYTEKVPNTPEPKQLTKKRDVKTTTKKTTAKTVTEIVEGLSGVRDIVDGLKKIHVSQDSVVNRLTFMGSLADNVPSWRCNIEALPYRDNYKTKRDDLTRRLFVEFNETVFDNGLEKDMLVTWDTKLRSTAGTTTNRLIKTSKGDKLRSSSIKLSTKVVDGPQRLRDTLIHEMCHAATWVIDEELRAAHGPLWRKWASKALRVFPELGEISRCHTMQIHFKYSYKCTKCGYSIQRHSKSIDMTKKCCGYCRGTFELTLNKKTKDGGVVSTPARKGGKNAFADYVKENYGALKHSSVTHAQVMKLLAQKFSAMKNDAIS